MKDTLLKSILFAWLAALNFSIVSCNKFLNEIPDNSVGVPESVKDLQALLDYSQRMNLRSSPEMGEASADDYFLTDDQYNAFQEHRQRMYTWRVADYTFGNDWSTAYQAIYTANYCLDQVEKINEPGSWDPEWRNVKGSALFFRSYNFLHLLWTYSKVYDENTAGKDLGIVLRLDSDFNKPSRRSSVKECYGRVIADTREAVSLLPDLPLHVMRPSKSAAYGLLARAYLSMGNYDSALHYSEQCLNLKNDLLDFNTDITVNASSAITFAIFNKETIFYTEMNGYSPLFYSSYYSSFVDTLLIGQYRQNDLRKEAYFKKNGQYYQFKGQYSGNTANFFSGIATDEIYFISIECLARKDRLDEAMERLNYLLKFRWRSTAAYIPLQAADQNEALQIILAERRKELLFRGLRWIDVKRLNREGANISLKRMIEGISYQLHPGSSYFALPLPSDIIKNAGLEQHYKSARGN